MDDRTKDLTGLFVRDLDQITLPPRGAWRRARGKENIAMRGSRYILTAGAVVAVLGVALLIGFQLRDRGQSATTPSASPTPSASGAAVVNPSPSANATATPATRPAPGGVVYNDDFGFIVAERNSSTSIRTESSNQRVASFTPANQAQTIAVSPDGKQIAYFAAGASGGPQQQLRVFPAAGNATEQTLITLAAGARGGGIAWSSDGAALLYSTETGNFGISGTVADNSSTLNVYELAANGRHGTTIDSQTGTGWVYRPIAWDRSADLAAAGMTGEGGFMSFYVTVRTPTGSSFTVNRADLKGAGMTMGRASSDAKVVVAALSADTVAYWPLADVTARKTTRTTGTSAPLWQPGTHKFAYVSAEGGFVLFQTDDGSAATVFSGVKSFTYVAAFRADGGAVVLAAHEAPAAGSTDFTLYRLSDGASVTFQELVGLMASVRFR